MNVPNTTDTFIYLLPLFPFPSLPSNAFFKCLPPAIPSVIYVESNSDLILLLWALLNSKCPVLPSLRQEIPLWVKRCDKICSASAELSQVTHPSINWYRNNNPPPPKKISLYAQRWYFFSHHLYVDGAVPLSQPTHTVVSRSVESNRLCCANRNAHDPISAAWNQPQWEQTAELYLVGS